MTFTLRLVALLSTVLFPLQLVAQGPARPAPSEKRVYKEFGDTKLKLGTEVTYNALSWFGVSGRFDHVAPGDSSTQSFNVITPRVLFHNGWDSQMEIALSYSRFIYGGDVVIDTGSPPTPDALAIPDADVLALTGWLWW